MENFESQRVVFTGGLNSNINHLYLSENEPGSGVELQNFEASLSGGYRRFSGYAPLIDEDIVDETNAEGRILGIFIYGNEIIAARKQKSGNTYKFYKSDGTFWDPMTMPFSMNSLGVTRVKYATFNFNGVLKIIFVDGINPATIFDGTTWTQIKSTNSGANYANAGGNQAINAPSNVEIFKNHIFISQNHLVAHSAPLSDYDWTVASGAGQLPVGYNINKIKNFRDSLVVFGTNNIKKIEVESSDFVLKEVTTYIGCVAGDSVIEVNGNLMFLAQDGFRPYAGTDKINDVELDSVSRKIQSTILEYIRTENLSELNAVLIRGKSQIRFFFSDSTRERPDSIGIVGCIRTEGNNSSWEWGSMRGLRSACCTSNYIGSEEFVLHGDYDGKVYRQEVGNSFDGDPVVAKYSTPYLDFGTTGVRKTMHKVKIFIKPEGIANLQARLTYDWMDPEKLNPSTYDVTIGNPASISLYSEAIYDTSIYSYLPIPLIMANVQGSGFSVQTTFTSNDVYPPYTLQGAVYEFAMEGKK